VQDELATHLALAADDLERRGYSPGEARRRAALALGGVDAAREQHRAARGLPSLDSVRQDLTYALRGFRREPGFTAVAVLMLAIGIGANTAVFSVVNPLLLRPLPFRDASRLVWMADTRPGGLSGVTYSSTVYEEIVRNVRSFEETTPYFAFFGYLSYALTGSGQSERLSAVMIGPRFFELLGVQPSAGRVFTREELARNGPKAVLLSHALWQRRFGADPAIVGRTITINDAAHVVVGIMPASFDFASVFAPGQRAEMYLPAVLDDMRGWGNTLSVIARLRPGVTVESARAELSQLMPRLMTLSEQSRGSTGSRRHAWVRGALVAAQIALACVLLVGAGLLLRSFYELQQTDLGFQPSDVSTIRVDPGNLLIDGTPEQRAAAAEPRNALLKQVMGDVGAIPGVERVGLSDALPLDRGRTWGLEAIGADQKPGESLSAFLYVVGPGYFDAMGIAIRGGRDFSFDDTRQRPGVLIVNETAARLLWAGESAVGRQARTGDTQLQVVGVVADVRQTNLEDETPAPQMYCR
jgi:MacB-like periplasmic core domain